MEYEPQPAGQIILCCKCGTAIKPNPTNMCANCLRTEVDITAGIPKHATVQFCRNCERYLQPPCSWVPCEFESRELLALCLKKLRGLNKVRLVDAGFIWTEPHSRRIKVKLTIQKEVFTATVLEQKFEVEYVISYQQCDGCARVMAKNTWKATVQVRQKAEHQRTFFQLEQLILKYNAHQNTSNIRQTRQGVDFQFGARMHAIKFVDFLQSVVPVRSKSSEQLISKDIHNGTSNYKFSYAVELVPACRDDLICIPAKFAQSLGGIGRLVLCSRVTNMVRILDFNTLQTADITAGVYWRTSGIDSICTSRNLREYYVLDVDPVFTENGYTAADVTIQRASEIGRNDNLIMVRTHLGRHLECGDFALGYDLENANINSESFDKLPTDQLPRAVLVKKIYQSRRAKKNNRKWKLKKLEMEVDPLLDTAHAAADAVKTKEDYEFFLQDLEDDPELRQSVNVYIDHNATSNSMQIDESESAEEIIDDGAPEIPLEDLLDELTLN